MPEGDDEMNEGGLESADLSEGKGIIRGRNGRPPTKVMAVPRRLQVFAEIDYIPLEGRVDSRAARQSVRALQPRQVVVLGGYKAGGGIEEANEKEDLSPVDEVKILADAAQSFVTSNNEVLMPSDVEMVELEVGHAAYSVRLIATPYRTSEETEKEDEPLDPVELHEAKLGACTVSLLDYLATGQKVALDGSIVLAPRSTSSSQPPIYISDGEVLLTDLRTELLAQGMKAEYRYVLLVLPFVNCLNSHFITRNFSAHAGYSQLVVNGKVVVKKDKDSGRIGVEGPLCEDFFSVRSIVCGQYVAL
jgi:cleavage and polyadenylation specificity factor subunit 2